MSGDFYCEKCGRWNNCLCIGGKMKSEIIEELREELAELAHIIWANWTTYMLGHNSADNHQRWSRQINTSYSDLSDVEKDSDRKVADKYLNKVLEHKRIRIECEDQNPPENPYEPPLDVTQEGWRDVVDARTNEMVKPDKNGCLFIKVEGEC